MRTQILGFVSMGLLALLASCGGGGGGGSGGPQSSGPDTTPAQFNIPAQTGKPLSTATTSDPIIVSGIDASTPVSITGGEYSINGAPYTSAAGTVTNGQTIRVRVTASQQFSTQTTAVLTIGGVSASFTVTTMDVDTTPDAFQFLSKTGEARNAFSASNAVTISGINSPAPVSIAGGEYSIGGGAYTSAAGTVSNNQTILVRLTSATQFSTALTATLTVGGVSAAFTVVTEDADTTPNAFVFPRKVNVPRNALATSNVATIAGINTSAPISVVNGEYSIDGGAFTNAAGSINAGQSVIVRTQASAKYSKVTHARVTVGSVTSDFEVTSELPAYVPDNVVYDGQDVVYLQNNANKLIFRWSLANERYLDSYDVGLAGVAPAKIAYSSAHKRLYLGYGTGTIRYIDPTAATPAETAFANIPTSLDGLTAAGNYLLAQSATYYASHYVFNAAGALTQQTSLTYNSSEYAWDPVTSRLYFFRDGISPNDLLYAVFNQTTGTFTTSGETPYHGSYNIQKPIRVSADGQYVLLGSGDIYNQSDLTWAGSLGAQIADARWLENGSMVTLTSDSNQTVLRRLGTTLKNLEQRTFTGQALRVFGSDTKMVVLVTNNSTVQFNIYVPSDDSDGDGTPNTQDAFPLDAAASVDTDNDGYPDAWNTGKSQSDSTTGLTLDAYPRDSACYLASHGDGTHCDYGATIPNYTPDQVVYDGDTIYLLSSANKRVYRWSISAGAYLNPYVVGINQGYSTIAPSKIAYSSAHKRLYLGYSSGAIQYIDTTATSSTEVAFGNTAMAVLGLASSGNYLLAQDDSGAWATHYVFNATGVITDRKDWNYYSREYAWDPTNSRIYFFRDDTSPNDLHYEVIDQGTGKIASAGETPYHGSYNIVPPIRPSVGGQYVLLGSGDIYNQAALTWAGSVGSQLTDARWLTNGSLAVLTTANNQTTLRRLGTNLATIEQLTFPGQALRIVGSDAKMVVLVLNNSTVQFRTYVPNDDSDGDGVLNTQDAFPLDAAASVDTDRDGYPNAWNAGKNQSDSTTGLSLDAYPQDSACYLPAHGDGVNCDYAATIPNYTPDQVVSEGDIVYLLSSANKRVYRWSIATGKYLNPYVVGINQGFTTIAPTKMAYVSSHHRLYLGYSTGAIQYVDVTATNPTEVLFANTAMAVGGLASAGNYLLAQDGSGAWGTHYIFNAGGAVTHQVDWNYPSVEYAWDPTTSRVYFFGSYLMYEVVDQTTGKITSSGQSPYYGSYSTSPPIRVSNSGQYVLLGSGDIYNQSGLTWAGSLGSQVKDARWFANGSLVTLTTSNNQTALRRLGTTLVNLEQLTYTGQALRIVGSDTKMAVIVLNNSTVKFYTYVPNDDSDNDGVQNTQDAFPLDAAASVDTDHDGYPDAWNAGKNQSDSTSGLSLDAYPQDSACYLLAHGDGVNCDYSATVPNYTPDQVINDGDTVYLLSSANKRIYRWSLATSKYLNPYVVGIDQGFSTLAPTKMAFSSSHHRLYLGYSTGAIRYIDVTGSGAEVPFANTALGVGGLASVGNYLLAQDGSGSWGTHYVFNSSGIVTQKLDWNYYSTEYAWDPTTSRVYFFRDNMSPNDLMYEVIDQTTGQITSSGETPYHGAYGIMPPIRVSNGGQYVLLGSGDIYNQSGLTWAGSLGSQLKDARWFANGSVVTLSTAGNQTVLRRLGTTLINVEQLTYTGQALRIVGSDAKMAVIVVDNGAVKFYTYVPNDDSDSDGVQNTQDAFPLDAAASVDTDRDGYPDSWNAGKNQSDSTTGLSLDAYPQDSACYLPAHGDGVHCDYSATIPNYVPDQVVNDGDTVYLLSTANKRVYRWSIATAKYLNPYIVGINQGFATLAPTKMAFSSSHHRLYLGYTTGAIQYIDVTGAATEVPFSNTAMAVGGLASVGNYVLAQDGSGAWDTHYVFSSSGTITDQKDWNYVSSEYTWDSVLSRVYFFRDGMSPNDLHYEVIDQATGKITSAGETPYHGNYSIAPPIRVTADGEYVLLGAGDLYKAPDLTWAGSLGKAIRDAQWKDNVLVDLDTTDNVEIRDASSRAVLASYQYTGQPIRIVFGQSDAYLIHVLGGTTSFLKLPFNDQDGDTMPKWWEQLYGLSDTISADATGDIDSDGVSNKDEYLNHSNPTVADTDGDGLTDAQEIVTYSTDPAKSDSDGDGLNDKDEVITHHTDPWDADSDNDGYTDLDEVLYGGDPNDPSGLPHALTSYSESFEGASLSAAWSAPQQGTLSWAIDSSGVSRTGSKSLRSGAVAAGQSSTVRFRGFLPAGQLSFYTRADPGSYYDRLIVLVDGTPVLYLYPTADWTKQSIPVTLGAHNFEWRYERDTYGSTGTHAVWIDDLSYSP